MFKSKSIIPIFGPIFNVFLFIQKDSGGQQVIEPATCELQVSYNTQ